MAIILKSVKCPSCGANLSIEEGRSKLFCSYCGTQIVVSDSNEYFFHHINEAEVKQAETDRIVQMKEMELSEKRMEANEKNRALRIKLSIALGAIAFISVIIGSFSWGFNFMIIPPLCIFAAGALWLPELNGQWTRFNGSANRELFPFFLSLFSPILGLIALNKQSEPKGLVPMPSSINGFRNKSFKAIETILRSAGYVNIHCVPLNDLASNSVRTNKKSNMVESITINGMSISSGKGKYPPDANIVISYHSKRVY